MAEFRKQKDVLRQLVKARAAIKHKYRLIKYNKSNIEKVLDETFKPIVEPLKKIASDKSQQNVTYSLPKFDKSILEVPNTPIKSVVHNSTFKFNNSTYNGDNSDANKETTFDSVISGDNNSTLRDDNLSDFQGTDSLSQSNELQSLTKKNSDLDQIYGIRKERNGYKIGDLPIAFEGNFIKVGNTNFGKTNRLVELLLFKRPDMKEVTDVDKHYYKQILETSGAHTKKDGTLRTHSNSYKFNNIIAPLFETVEGKGIFKNNSREGISPFKIASKISVMDYKYWDDPNELVDRLRLLVAERSAGNTSHNNEILSIIEELREGGYIY